MWLGVLDDKMLCKTNTILNSLYFRERGMQMAAWCMAVGCFVLNFFDFEVSREVRS